MSTGLLDVLAVLDRSPGGTYGYEIIRATGGARRTATIYEQLGRLERSGWITQRWETAPAGGRPRRVCVLTDTGRKRARELLARRRSPRERAA